MFDDQLLVLLRSILEPNFVDAAPQHKLNQDNNVYQHVEYDNGQQAPAEQKLNVQFIHPLRESEEMVASHQYCPLVEDLLSVLNELFVG